MNRLRDWWPVVVGLLLAGMWLGTLENRITQIEKFETYQHGTYAVPSPKGQ